MCQALELNDGKTWRPADKPSAALLRKADRKRRWTMKKENMSGREL